MIRTMNLPAARSLRFTDGNCSSLAGTARSDRNLCFPGRNASRTVIMAAVATAPPPLVETATRRRPLSLYEVLGVNRNASLTEIKSAYRSLAKMYHPDASHSVESDGVDFIEIHKAYETLSDPSARALYDLSLGVRSGQPRRSSADDNEFGYRSAFYTPRRWETDQCW